jgi:hypothetical protein
MSAAVGEVWLGDLLRVIAALTQAGQPPNLATVKAAAKMLGLDLKRSEAALAVNTTPVRRAPKSDPPDVDQRKPDDADDVPAGEDFDAAKQQKPDTDQRETHADAGVAESKVAGLRELWHIPPDKPWQGVTPLAIADEKTLRKPLPLTPLLRERVARGVMHIALARSVRNGEIDVDEVVDRLSTARPITSLPRLPRPTLSFGAQVLLDRSEPMVPFLHDQTVLADTVRAVVGPGLTDVRYFAGSPLRGTGMRSRWSWTPYQAPSAGRQVLVVTSFDIVRGFGRRCDPEEWAKFVAMLRTRGTVPIALVPFPRPRWPYWATTLMPIVCWDRTTTVGTVRAALGGRFR